MLIPCIYRILLMKTYSRNFQKASQKTLELTNGTLSGSHIHTTSTGIPVWMPFSEMKEFREYLTQALTRDICAEKEDCDKTLGF